MPASPYTRRHDSGRNWLKKKDRKGNLIPIGRPKGPRKVKDSYNDHIGHKIAQKMAEGESIASIIRNYDWAPRLHSTVRAWYKRHESFRRMMDQAYVDRADYYVEKILELMQKVEDGKLKPGVARLLIDEYKWIACKLHPKYMEQKLANLALNGGEGGINFNIVLAGNQNQKKIGKFVDIEYEEVEEEDAVRIEEAGEGIEEGEGEVLEEGEDECL